MTGSRDLVASEVDEAIQSGGAFEPQALPLQLTAIALLMLPMGPWYVRPVILGLAGAALLSKRILFSPGTWGAVAVLVAVRIASDWPLADNHIYLLAYWSLAIALASGAANPTRTLAESSRWLLGVAFALAVLWKAVLAADFVDGRFFRVTLITDPRFQEATMLIGGLTRPELVANAKALSALPEGAEPLEAPTLVEPLPFRSLAAVSTYGILALETIVAAAVLLPLTARFVAIRHAMLLTFCLVTYAMAPVAGFGWLLVVMGLAGTGGQRSPLTLAYLMMFVLILLYNEVPWPALLLDAVGGTVLSYCTTTT